MAQKASMDLSVPLNDDEQIMNLVVEQLTTSMSYQKLYHRLLNDVQVPFRYRDELKELCQDVVFAIRNSDDSLDSVSRIEIAWNIRFTEFSQGIAL